MPLSRLINFLDDNNKKYVTVKHSTAFTAQEIAASAHVPGKEMAKCVMLKIDGDLKMAVLPSTHTINFDQLKDSLNAKEVSLASEKEFDELFPDCELGAMPPFGNLYNIETMVAESLADDEEIAFNAGTHKELVKMGYKDFEELAQPQILPLAAKQF